MNQFAEYVRKQEETKNGLLEKVATALLLVISFAGVHLTT